MIQNLLMELQAEELPPKALSSLSTAFAQGIVSSLSQQGLLNSDSQVTPFATPRRLAVHISQVSAKAADKQIQLKLMPVSVGTGQCHACIAEKNAGSGIGCSATFAVRAEVGWQSHGFVHGADTSWSHY
jgi:glycyl-tRNA synthetase beta chain